MQCNSVVSPHDAIKTDCVTLLIQFLLIFTCTFPLLQSRGFIYKLWSRIVQYWELFLEPNHLEHLQYQFPNLINGINCFTAACHSRPDPPPRPSANFTGRELLAVKATRHTPSNKYRGCVWLLQYIIIIQYRQGHDRTNDGCGSQPPTH